MKRAAAVLGASIGLWLVACGPSTEDSGPDILPPKSPVPIIVRAPANFETSLNCPKGTYLTYENFGAGFLSTYCLSCHSARIPEEKRAGAPITANFDTALEASRYRGLMLSKTQGNTPSMPPGQVLKAREKEAFAEWLNCGTPHRNSQ